ncbi:MAG: hypothetical protein AAGI17_01810 [Planctomycetota bacterium]
MRRATHALMITAAAGALSALVACGSGNDRQLADWDERARVDTNAWAVRTAFENQATNGVITRRTIYQTHFVPGTAALTPRGEEEMEILARHFAKYGSGQMFFPRDGENEDLYRMRVESLFDIATSEGLRRSSLNVTDGFNASQTTPGDRVTEAYRKPSVEDPYAIHGRSGGSATGGN